MAGLSLSQAAKATGRSKSTIGRAIKAGRLSAIRNDDETFSIDPAELFRVFPRGGPEPSHAELVGTPGTAAEQLEIKTLRDELVKAQQRAAVAEAQAEERARSLEAAERNLADLRRILPAPSGSWWRFWSG
ncbi:hypothetical protein [Paracoccus marcusii]|uniref:hypothetical protein n=1 Tax=Paracoccus marcusii TaxID=59779 RepID=UPI001C3C6BB3|nr:hypothetical protein [Paracoccus marcusii]